MRSEITKGENLTIISKTKAKNFSKAPHCILRSVNPQMRPTLTVDGIADRMAAKS